MAQVVNADSLSVASLSPIERRARVKDALVSRIITASGATAIVILLLIFVFLAKDAIPTFHTVSVKQFLTGTSWRPEFETFGIVPLLAGSFFVTLGALVIAVPVGVTCAIYIAEVAPRRIRELLKVTIEVLAGIPSVVVGFIGLAIAAPYIQGVFNLPTGLTALTGSLMLAFMSMPTIVSISEDAIVAVPKAYRDGSLALGATKWETIRRVVVPSARSGIIAACMLGVGRAVGETMTVLMVTGNASVVPNGLAGIVPFFLGPVRTMTATIAADMGETVQRSPHYHALFAVGLTLFVITFVINLVADLALRRGRSFAA
ncbi:MAG: phosphate ABC transporter permease subunit PstC [Armatimonadetes bacterium]|nr:phosphate ABC transporter permease subunit PstC [Armatimonadota bacterium]